MKYAIVVHGRFFAFDLVKALQAQNKEVVMLTNYPKWAVRRFGINTASVRSFWLHGVVGRCFQRLRAIGMPLPEEALHRSFGSWAASQLQTSDADVIFCFSGVAEETFSRLKDSGKSLLLARCSTHIDVQREILLQEQQRSGTKIEIPSDWIVHRENREYRLADAVVVLSSFAKQSFINSDFPQERLKLLLLGAELSHFRPPANVVADRRIRITQGRPLRILYVGTLSYRKGAADLLKIAETLSDRNQFEFSVVGPIDPEVRSLATRLSRFARLVDKQPQNKLFEYYAWADLFIFPTLEDGFPVVLAQAQASGLPVITTPNCSGPDMIKEGETGWICPAAAPVAVADRLRWCHDNRAQLSKIVEGLQDTFQARDWSFVAHDFERLAEDMTSQSQPVNLLHKEYS